MAGIPASNESPEHRAIRLAVGTAIGFIVAQLFAWPLAFAAPVVAIIMLSDAAPLKFVDWWRIFRNASSFVLLGALVTWLLTPWPVILVTVAVVLVYVLFLFLFTSGAHILVIIGSIVGFIVIPILTVMLPELGFLAAAFFILDFAVGMLAASVAWLIVPLERIPPQDDHHGPLSKAEAAPLAATLTAVVGGLLVVFLVMGWSKVLVLVYSIFFALTYSSVTSGKEGIKYIIANVIYGGVAMFICYFLVMLAPSLPFAVALVFLTVFLFGTRLFGDGPTAAFWNSGLYGFVIMFGGLLLSDSTTLATLAGRVWQLILATIYTVFAFSVVEWVWSWRSNHKQTVEGETIG